MVCYNLELNDNKIFSEDYLYKIILNGYIENNKYENNVLAEKEYILFISTHGNKYQLYIRNYIKNIIITDIDIVLEKVEEYKIEKDNSVLTQFYFLPKNKDNVLKYSKVKNISNYFKEKLLKNSEEEDLESFCISSNDYLIFIEDIKQSKNGFIIKEKDRNINLNKFESNIFSKS